MPRPKLTPEHLDPSTRSMLAQVAWGWLTASEAAHRMRVSPQTVTRLVRRLFAVSATAARRKYADSLARAAMNPDPMRDARIAHQMRQAVAEHDARQPELRDFAVSDQPSPKTDTE